MRSLPIMALRSALLARTPLLSADLYTLSLVSGAVYRWTSFDSDVTFSGNTWSSVGPAIERSEWSARNTTEVTQLDVRLHSTGTDFDQGNLKTLIHNGMLDGAFLQLDRAFMASPGDTSLGIITLFGGRIGKVAIDSLGANLTAQASNVILQQNVPRNTYQLGCIHTLYDSGCTLNRAAFTSSHTVTVANQLNLGYADPPADPRVFILGVAEITSGAGAGQRRAIDNSSSAAVLLAYPLYIIPAPGDTFTLTQGCNKTRDICRDQFNNLPNFRGFPFIPKAELGL
jgi:uncharacterized phage protein (TIGR02218 family)